MKIPKELTQEQLQEVYDKLTPLEKLVIERAKGMLWGLAAAKTREYLDLQEELELAKSMLSMNDPDEAVVLAQLMRDVNKAELEMMRCEQDLRLSYDIIA